MIALYYIHFTLDTSGRDDISHPTNTELKDEWSSNIGNSTFYVCSNCGGTCPFLWRYS